MPEAGEGIAWRTAFSSITCYEAWDSKSIPQASGFDPGLEEFLVVIILVGESKLRKKIVVWI
jgi:hypothetical protein